MTRKLSIALAAIALIGAGCSDGAAKSGDTSTSTGTSTSTSTAQSNKALKFAACMRENGVMDFPDPTPDGPLIDTTRIPSMTGKQPRDDPGLKAALRKCATLSTAALRFSV